MDTDIIQNIQDQNIWEQTDSINREINFIHFQRKKSIRYAQLIQTADSEKNNHMNGFSKTLQEVQQRNAFILQIDYHHGPVTAERERTDGFYVDQIKSLSKYVELMLDKPIIPLCFSNENFTGQVETLNNQDRLSEKSKFFLLDKSISPIGVLHSQRHAYTDKVITHNDMHDKPFPSNVIWLDGAELVSNHLHLKPIESSIPIWVRINGHITPAEILAIYNHLNPNREEGKIVFSTSIGMDISLLKDFIKTLQKAAAPVIWLCDPLGSHVDMQDGPVSIAILEEIIHELDESAKAHAALGSHIAGFKITLSSENYINHNKNVSALYNKSVLVSNAALNFQQALQVCSNFVHANVRKK